MQTRAHHDRGATIASPAYDPTTPVRIAAGVAGAVGVIAMVAVLAGAPTLTAIVTGRVPVAANTGLGLALAAVALFALTDARPAVRRFGRAVGGSVLALGGLTLASWVLAWEPGVDSWLFPAPPGASEMSPQTAAAFVLLGTALVVARTRTGWVAARAAAAVVIVVALANVLDSLYDATTPTILGRYTQMALPTAIATGALAIGVSFLDPRHSLFEQMRGPGVVGTLTRRLLVAALTIPIIVGWLRLAGERAGLYGSAYGVALTTIATIVLFAVAIRVVGRAVAKTEEERRAAEEERRRMEDELAAAQAEIADLWNRAPIGYHSLDAEGRFLHVNQTELDMLGYSRQEMVDGRMSFPDLLTPASLQRFGETFSRFKADGMLRDVEFELRRRDGTIVPVRVTATAVRDAEGNFVASRSAVRDISEQRAAETARELALEEAEAASAAKSQFLSRMSHELRTPLNSVLGFAQLLEADHLNPDQRESVAYIRRAGQHLLDLINEVLDISRIEQGRLTISVEPVAVHECLEEVASFVAPMAAERGVDIGLDDIASCAPVVLADRQRLRQVLLNFMANAVKYNRHGGAIRVGCGTAPEGMVRIAVTDTGPGIPRASQHRLFQPFDRLGAEATDVEGSGMGLALSKALAGAMGGQVGVESEVGRGSTFWIMLPRGTAATAPESTQPRAVDRPAADGEERVVLYIEDNPANLRLVERIIAGMPRVRLMTAIQGRIGLDLAREHRPDLVLLDVHLPDIDGGTVLSSLRLDPTTADIPVVILSADASEIQRRTLLGKGAVAYLTKPVNVSELVATIERLAVASAGNGVGHAI